MPRGPQSRTLSHDQIERLEKFRRAPHDGAPHGYSFPQLQIAMSVEFGWRTLQKALQGRPVRELSHAYIVQWIERYLMPAPVLDAKSSAAAQEVTR